MDKKPIVESDFSDNLIIVKHQFEGNLDLNHYTKTMTVLNRQLRKSLKYAGLNPKQSPLEISKVENGSLIAYLQLAQQIAPYASALLNNRNIDIVRVWLSRIIAPSWMLEKQDVRDGITVGQFLSDSPNNGLNINVSGQNNSVTLYGVEQGKLIEDNCRYRLQNWQDLSTKPFKNVPFSYKVLDTDEEKYDYGEIEGIEMRLPLKWADGIKAVTLEGFYNASGKKPLLVDALVFYDKQTEKPTHLMITSFNGVAP